MPLTDRLAEITHLSQAVILNLWFSLVALVIVGLLRFVYFRVITRRVEDVSEFHYWKRLGNYLTWSILAIALTAVWLRLGLGPITQFVALVSAGLAIAMHDTVSNVTGWIFILWRRPFMAGHRIEIDGIIGDVIDIRLFQFSVIEVGGSRIGAEQSTGRIIHVPNGKVLREPVVNFDVGFSYVWDEIPTLVTFESDWETAKAILVEIVNRHVETFSAEAEREIRQAARKFLIFAGKLTPIVYTSIEDSGVLLTMRFMVRPRTRRGIKEKISEDILREFAKHDTIDFAYPSVRYYRNDLEGKAGTRPAE